MIRASTVYMPTRTFGTKKVPFALLVVPNLAPVWALITWTFTPAIGWPEVSVTLPRTAPVVTPWADSPAGTASAPSASANATTTRTPKARAVATLIATLLPRLC